jgi:hypothetical protein
VNLLRSNKKMSIGNSLHMTFHHIVEPGSLGRSGGGILPQNATGSAAANDVNSTLVFHGGGHSRGSHFSKGMSSLGQTDPSFVKTLQSNIQSAVQQGQSQGKTGSALSAVVQQAVTSTFKNASATDQQAINTAFGTSIFSSNGTFNASALQAAIGPVPAGGGAPAAPNSAVVGTQVAQQKDSDGDSDGSGPAIGGVNISA